MAEKLHQPWDDGISSLVALSGESLNIHGGPLKRFPIARLGQAALVIPVKVHGETIGLLVVMRKEAEPFTENDQTMMEAVADYASISLANALLFRELEDRARSLQKAMENARRSERSKDDLIREISEELRRPLIAAKDALNTLVEELGDQLSDTQNETVAIAEDNLQRLLAGIESMGALHPIKAPGQLITTDLGDLVRQRIRRNQHVAHQTGLGLLAELPTEPVYAFVDPNQIRQVLDGLITNAVRFSPQGGQITIRVSHTDEDLPYVSVQDTGLGIQEEDLSHVFDRYPQQGPSSSSGLSGLGLRLAFVKDIITAHGGQIWVESQPDQGSIFHFTLRPPD